MRQPVNEMLLNRSYTIILGAIKKIEKLAQRFELSKSEVVREAINEYYKKREAEL